ncbi:aminodeoxychorismate synthase component I [Puteibacter caeruleilacunae]|nr:aminodeoxychorismate synthase component I [Puteibacter caeruleilacunae]
MNQLSKHTRDQMNKLGAQDIPFLFIIDFDSLKPLVYPLDQIPNHILYQTPASTNHTSSVLSATKEILFSKRPISFEKYSTAFDKVMHHLNRGDTYLLNLTQPTELETNLTLKEVFVRSQAKYKLLIDGEMVCFSPEIFVKIEDGKISSYPMKGTIDASIPDAENKILNDPKEFAEHNTIVDLIRNDLSMVSKKVRVEKFRYIDRLKTNQKELLQVSSKIVGELPDNYAESVGDILAKLLPAGSISGAPKEKTVEVIKDAEQYDRGYYTGIFGIFDGVDLDSAVIIRYMENDNGQLVYKSGGGITAKSDVNDEYQELIDKVYAPIA